MDLNQGPTPPPINRIPANLRNRLNYQHPNRHRIQPQPIPLVPINPPVNQNQNQNMADQQFNTLITALTNLTNAMAPPPPGPAAVREVTIIRPKVYKGEGEDPYEWFEEFINACNANNWATHARRYEIVPAYLAGPALTWFQLNQNGFGNNFTGGGNNTFETLFKAKFASSALKNIWQADFHNIKQGAMSVDNFNAHFRKA